jgi:DJ-1 family protein
MKNVLVLIADGSEEIESVTVIDILRRAHIDVTIGMVGEDLEVRCANKVRIVADTLLKDIHDATNKFDAIVLPGGGKGAETFASDRIVQQLLKEFEAKDKIIAAMCASTTALYAAKVGEGKRATSWPAFKDELQRFYNYQETPVVVDGNLITSRGPGTAMAWSLSIVEAISGKSKMKEVADHLLIMFPL